jgi:hypothetical protein
MLLFSAAASAELNDSDSDGVIDEWDKCPSTHQDIFTNKQGCSTEQLGKNTDVSSTRLCITIENDLSLNVNCAKLASSKYRFVLNPFKIPNQPFDPNFYWKLDFSSLKQLDNPDTPNIEFIRSLEFADSRFQENEIFINGNELIYYGSSINSSQKEGIYKIDISHPENPSISQFLQMPDYTGYHVDDNYVYVGANIYNVSDGHLKSTNNSMTTTSRFIDIFVHADYVYMAAGSEGLKIYNVSNKSHPVHETTYSFSEYKYADYKYADAVTVVNDKAYVLMEGLHILDVSNPSNPQELGSLLNIGYGNQVLIKGDYAYLTSKNVSYKDVLVVNISNSSTPVEVTYITLNNEERFASGLYIKENRLFIANGKAGFSVIDITDPKNFRLIATVDTDSPASAISVKDNYIYVICYPTYPYGNETFNGLKVYKIHDS